MIWNLILLVQTEAQGAVVMVNENLKPGLLNSVVRLELVQHLEQYRGLRGPDQTT